MSKGSRLKTFFYVLGALVLLVGLWGIYMRFAVGDREASYGSYITWGLWVAMYIFFSGVATGSFMVAALDHLLGVKLFKGTGTVALWITVVTLPAALVTIGLDLGHMERIWKVYTQPNFNSLLAQLVWGYTIFMIIALIALWLVVQRTKGKVKSNGLLRPTMGIGLFLAIFLSGGIGAFLGLNAGRESWNSAMLPAQFPIFSLMSGIAVMMIVLGWFMPIQDERHPMQLRVLSIALAILLVVKAYYLWTDYSQALYSGSPSARQVVDIILYGRFGWVFWVLQLGVGMVIPFLLLVLPRFNRNKLWVGIIGVLVLIGMGIARANIVFPTLATPELEGLATAFTGPHLGYDYFPSLMEWAVVLGVIGAATLAFLIGTDFLPLFPEKSQEVTQ
ncbi:MAG: NrfD/PsrC family molybdoenzyme membrane anchor subunit [Bellilinea sp.]